MFPWRSWHEVCNISGDSKFMVNVGIHNYRYDGCREDGGVRK